MELSVREAIFKAVMAYPAVRLLGFYSAVALSVGRMAAKEPQANPGQLAESAAPPPRAVSERVASLLAAATPRFEISTPAEAKLVPAPSPSLLVDKPANEIVRLPNFVVREPRVPTPEDVRTPRALEIYAMNKYLGKPNGFSRAVLNRVTIADGWKHLTKNVPILNRFEWFSSPEKTALDMYYDDEVRKKLRDLSALMAIREGNQSQASEKSQSPAPGAAPPPDGK